MRGRNTRRSALIPLVASLFVPLAAGAQKLEEVPTPIEVTAKPALAVVGAEIELAGSSVRLKDQTTVRLRIRVPSGAPVELQAEVDAEGEYSATYEVTAAGTHTVTAVAPDGKNEATVTFTAAYPSSVSQQVHESAEELVEEAVTQAGKLGEAVAKMPVSPPQQELVQRLTQVEQRLAEAPAHLAKVKEAMGQIDEIVEQYPDAYPEFAPLYEELAAVEAAADPLAEDLARQVEDLALGITDCDRLDMAAEALNFMGLVLNLIGRAPQVAIGLLVDKTFSTRVSARVPALAQDDLAKFAFDNSVKHSATLLQGFDTWRAGVHTYFGDVATFAMQEAFGVYCEKFEGPFDAAFHLEYYEGSEKWLAYDVELTGMLFLRYEKAEGGGAIPVTGEFEGKADFSKPWENFTVIEPGARPHVFARMSKPPLLGPVPYLPELGKLGRAAMGMLRGYPGYFRVPVEGLIQGDTLSLKILPATQDYPERAKGSVGYVLWSAQVMIPQVKKFEVKYFGAHYILSRATHKERGTSDQPFPLKIVVDPAAKTSTITQSFTRTEDEPGNFLITWKLDLNACNPSCPY